MGFLLFLDRIYRMCRMNRMKSEDEILYILRISFIFLWTGFTGCAGWTG
jgi:hypothetical protein